MTQSEETMVNVYLENPTLAKQVSFGLQKEEILKKYITGIFPKENQSLYEYVFYLIHRFPIDMLKSRYIEECLLYLYDQENHYLVSATKELYPEIAKKQSKKETIERSLRYFINKEFLNISEDVRKEIFSTPEGNIPTNLFFLFNLTEYIKTHYYEHNEISFSNEQREYFLSHLKNEDNALYILARAELRKDIERFLYEKLGHFRYSTTNSQQILIDYIMLCLEEERAIERNELYTKEFKKKWQIYDFESFTYKMNSIAFTIEKAYKHIDEEVYREIFGDCDLHRTAMQYSCKVAQYLKEQDFVRKRVLDK